MGSVLIGNLVNVKQAPVVVRWTVRSRVPWDFLRLL